MPCSILIVDDESILAMLLADVFNDEGFTVRTAPNGAAALDEHARDPADLILSDVMMPIIDGLTLISVLRQRGDPTPVVLMSAVSPWVPTPPDVPILRKPFDIDHLLTVVCARVPPDE